MRHRHEAACKNSIPNMTWKSSMATAIRLATPDQAPIFKGTSLANPAIGLASEFTAFILRQSCSSFSPSRRASWSATKLWVAPVSTMARVDLPLMLTSTNINPFPLFLFQALMAFNNRRAPIRGSSSSVGVA